MQYFVFFPAWHPPPPPHPTPALFHFPPNNGAQMAGEATGGRHALHRRVCLSHHQIFSGSGHCLVNQPIISPNSEMTMPGILKCVEECFVILNLFQLHYLVFKRIIFFLLFILLPFSLILSHQMGTFQMYRFLNGFLRVIHSLTL